MKTPKKMYAVMRVDGKFRQGVIGYPGSYGLWGKLWRGIGALKSHLAQHDKMEREMMKGNLSDVVIEYDLVESRRFPLKDLL